MSNLQNSIYKWLYLVILMFFLLSIILLLSEFWIWGNILDTFPTYEYVWNPPSDENYWNQVLLDIKDFNYSFFINQVFPTAVFTAILSCISILGFKKIKPSQNLSFIKFDMTEKSNLFMSIVLKIITAYSAISWFLIPLAIPNDVYLFPIYTNVYSIWQLTAPYYYTYFFLLTSISFLSYLGMNRLEFRVNPYTKTGIINYYKN